MTVIRQIASVLVPALAVGWLVACSPPVVVQSFDGPAFDPVRFFTGHVKSWGVLEDRGGSPTAVVTTDCQGSLTGDTLTMVQTLVIGTDAPVTRRWTLRRTGPGQFEASANDMVGTATGTATGRVFHWEWTLALEPGNAIKNVTMEQWWYLQEDGSMLNRTMVKKFGIIAAEVTEVFKPT